MVFCSRRCRGGLGRFRRKSVGMMVVEDAMEYCPRV